MEKNLSPVVATLDEERKKRYIEKLSTLGIDDPYLIPAEMWEDFISASAENIPQLEYPDICNYVMSNPSPYTGRDLKHYKSLDAWDYFWSGGITELQQCLIPEKNTYIIRCKVRYNQDPNETTHSPWAAVQRDGQVLFAHCDCNFKLEVCPHIAATLFALDSAVEHVNSSFCTDDICIWCKIPPGTGLYKKLSEIDFGGPKKKKRKAKRPKVKGPSPNEIKKFYEALAKLEPKPVCLSGIPEYSHLFVPKESEDAIDEETPSTSSDAINLDTPSSSSDAQNEHLCYCQETKKDSIMIECKSGLCTIKSFHLQCLGLKNPPKYEEWLCLSCRKIARVSKSKAETL